MISAVTDAVIRSSGLTGQVDLLQEDLEKVRGYDLVQVMEFILALQSQLVESATQGEKGEAIGSLRTQKSN